jgi:hypothetical protein
MTIRIPLTQRTVDRVRCDSPSVVLRVRTRFGDTVSLPFLVDTAADLSAISIALARRHGILFSQSRSGFVGGLVGRTRRYHGTIRVKVGRRWHRWPCYFIETPSDVGAETAVSVLGRAGFLDDYEFWIDDQFLTISRRTLLRRWWRAFGRWVTRPFVTIRQPEEPL